jgi:hypothetical protein
MWQLNAALPNNADPYPDPGKTENVTIIFVVAKKTKCGDWSYIGVPTCIRTNHRGGDKDVWKPERDQRTQR